MLKSIRPWLKVLGLFLYKCLVNFIWIKITFLLIALFDVKVLGATPDFGWASSICLGFGIFMALDTTYNVEGKKYKIWSKEAGFIQIKDVDDKEV